MVQPEWQRRKKVHESMKKTSTAVSFKTWNVPFITLAELFTQSTQQFVASVKCARQLTGNFGRTFFREPIYLNSVSVLHQTVYARNTCWIWSIGKKSGARWSSRLQYDVHPKSLQCSLMVNCWYLRGRLVVPSPWMTRGVVSLQKCANGYAILHVDCWR